MIGLLIFPAISYIIEKLAAMSLVPEQVVSLKEVNFLQIFCLISLSLCAQLAYPIIMIQYL
jgi:hypothetical protein